MPNVKGKSVKALTLDIAEGYATVNPIFLKLFETEQLKDIYKQIAATQNEIRAGRFPTNDLAAIRMRNLKLQRLFSASMIIRNFAKERRIVLV